MPSLASAPTASVTETEKPKSYAGPQDEGDEFFDLPTPRPISEHSRHWPSLEDMLNRFMEQICQTPSQHQGLNSVARSSPRIACQQLVMTTKHLLVTNVNFLNPNILSSTIACSENHHPVNKPLTASSHWNKVTNKHATPKIPPNERL